MDAVEVVLLDNLANHRQAVVAHGRHGAVPEALLPPGTDEPVGMGGFYRIALLQLGIDPGVVRSQVAALDLIYAQAPPGFLVALMTLLDEPVEVVDALLAPAREAWMLDGREERAAVMRCAFV